MRFFIGNIRLLVFLAFFLAAGIPSGARPDSDNGSPKLKTVVIDAGHGGKDAGAVSKDRKTYEKTLVLSIAKSFGQKIEAAYPDVKVIYTRTTDKFVELNERAAIANRNKADLFISIHINANTSTSPKGFSAHILGQSSSKNRDLFSSNMELCKRENSVILLEEDYDTKYQGYDPEDPESAIFFNLMQNAYYEQSILFAAEVTEHLAGGPITNNRGISQDPFLVLWKTTMPSVLLELGFISNSADLAVLRNSSQREEICQRLFEAFKSFKAKYDGSVDYQRSEGSAASASRTSSAASSSSVSSGTTSSKTAASSTGKTKYGVQIFSLSREIKANDKSLKGYSPEIFQSGKIYRYVVGVSSTEAQVREKYASIKKDFPDSYIVKIENGVPSKL